MMHTTDRISAALACAGLLLSGAFAWGMDPEPQDAAYDSDFDRDDTSGAREVEVESEAESGADDDTDAKQQTAAEAHDGPPAAVIPAAGTAPASATEKSPVPATEKAPTPVSERGPAPTAESASAPEIQMPAPADDAPAVAEDEAPPPGAGSRVGEPAKSPAEAPGAPLSEGAAPVADEAGVLPGEPGDEPGVPAELADDTPGPAAAGAQDGKPAMTGDTAASDPAAPAESREPDVQRTLYLLGTEVPPGAIDWLSWSASESFEGISTPTPILIVNGTSPGPTLCLTAAVHGDELNGVEMVRRIMYSLDPEKLNGAVIGAPIVNLHGFRRSSRYLPDRRDLNRYFPGSPTGSSASRIAYSFFHEVIVNCDALVDVHTGSFHRANLPQIRADLSRPEVVELTKGFGATVVLHSVGGRGTLRRAATDADIPSVTLEAGEPMRLQPKEVAHGVKGIETLLDKLGMVNKVSLWGDPQPVYYEARWIRANSGGILFSGVNLGERIRKGEVLGSVTDPITNKRSEIRSPYDGRIIGRALNQVVMPGFAAFHVGIQTSERQLRDEQQAAATAEATGAGQADAEQPSTAGRSNAPASSSGAMPGEIEAEEEAEEYMEEERPE